MKDIIIQETIKAKAYTWVCPYCAEVGKNFKIQSPYEKQVIEWRKNHLLIHKLKGK